MLPVPIRKLGLRLRRCLVFFQSGKRPTPGVSPHLLTHLFPLPWAMARLSAVDQSSAGSFASLSNQRVGGWSSGRPLGSESVLESVPAPVVGVLVRYIVQAWGG